MFDFDGRENTRDRLAGIVESSEDAIIAITKDGVITDWNGAATRLYGYSAKEAVGLNITMLVPLDRANELAEIRNTLAAGGRIRQYESVRQKKDGRLVDVLLSIAPITGQVGTVIGFAGFARDITNRKRIEEILVRSEEQFRAVVEGAPTGMYISTDGLFRYLNPTALAMFGAASADEIIGRDVLERIHPDSRSAVIERIRLVREERRPVPLLEERLLRLDGTVFDAEVTAIPFTFEGRVGAVVFVRDITARKRAEVERGILEQQLRQAQKMEAIGQLAGAVAHDFNNLLMGINSQTELLMKTPDPRQVEERAKTILSAVESAGQLTKKLLAFSRIQELATSTFDLNQLVAETIEFMGCLLPEGISVDVRLSESPCWVNADRVQMEQTLINLVLNARDAMPEGGKLVLSSCHVDITADDLGLHDGVPSGAYALISVADTGHGIPEQQLEKIFEPFFTTKPKGRGTGLGLSIAYGIVSQSGGRIRVKSTVGAGTTFTIYIPSVERPQAEPPKLNPCPLEISEASCPQEGTVLVVDDEAIIRRSIRAYLELNGLSVLDCADASEALKVASELKDRLALLITDVVMPNMTGIELARALVKQMPELPILFMSGYAAGERGYEEFRQVKFLQKPFACATLLDTVCEGLRVCPRRGKIQN